jgi:hypothetical protein
MPFPVSITGCVRIPVQGTDPARIDRALRRIEEMLEAAAASSVTRQGTSTRFRAGVFRLVWNVNILGPLGSGVICVDDGGSELRISYRGSTVQMLMAASALSLFVASPALGRGWTAVWLPAAAWLCLFGLNYLIILIRFPRWLKHGVKKAI